MKTAQHLMEEMTCIARHPYHPKRESLPPDLAGKLTHGKAKDWPTHGKYIATSFGVSSLADVNIGQMEPGILFRIEKDLEEAGRGESVVRNTKNTYKLLREFAIAIDLLEPDPLNYGIPKRNRLIAKQNGRAVTLRGRLRKKYAPYAKPREDFNPTLKSEIDQLEHHYTARYVRGRARKAIDKKTWKSNVDRLERFYGAMERLGIPHEQMTLRDFVNIDYLEQYVEFFLEEHPDPTYTLKDILNWAGNIARNYYNEKGLFDEIVSVIHQMRFVRIKDHEEMVIKVTADDLYTLEDKLVQHAFAYDRMFYHRKPGLDVQYPQAMVAWHYGRALAIMLANRCWFRRSNLFGIVWDKHLYYYSGKLHFKFSAEEMKSKETHLGQVIDLWRGQAGYNQLVRVLDRYREVRHHLVEKFKLRYPDKPEPVQLLLNMAGKPYGPSGAWTMFSCSSRAYLGNDKEIHPHAPRLIVPTYLMLEYDYAILGSIQALLDHKSIQTTERHYLRMKRLMSGQAARRVMDERMAKEQQAHRLAKMERMLLEIRNQLAESSTGGQPWRG
ncbi:hypothetical protein D3C86_1125000 [compost metagenome]